MFFCFFVLSFLSYWWKILTEASIYKYSNTCVDFIKLKLNWGFDRWRGLWHNFPKPNNSLSIKASHLLILLYITGRTYRLSLVTFMFFLFKTKTLINKSKLFSHLFHIITHFKSKNKITNIPDSLALHKHFH